MHFALPSCFLRGVQSLLFISVAFQPKVHYLCPQSVVLCSFDNVKSKKRKVKRVGHFTLHFNKVSLGSPQNSVQSCSCSAEWTVDEKSSELMQTQPGLFLASHNETSSSWLLLLLLVISTRHLCCHMLKSPVEHGSQCGLRYEIK